MKYLEPFSSLGPRPTCGENERKAADFARDTMEGLGINVHEERFQCNPSMFRKYILVFLFAVALGVLPIVAGSLGYLLAALGCMYARKLYTDLVHNKTTIINSFILQNGFTNKQVLNFGIPDTYVEHGKHSFLLKELGLDANSMTTKILKHFSLKEVTI